MFRTEGVGIVALALLAAGCVGGSGIAALADGPPGFEFGDYARDTKITGSPETGPAAPAVDILAVRVFVLDNALEIRLALANLSAAYDLVSQPGFHIQYAVGFSTPASGAGYAARARLSAVPRSRARRPRAGGSSCTTGQRTLGRPRPGPSWAIRSCGASGWTGWVLLRATV